MSEEVFDVVNAQDEPVGRAPRSQVHRERLWHRAVHVLVFNRAGEVFLQKRSMAKDEYPGAWGSSCSGHVDAGEDYDAAVRREFAEELGVTLASVPERLFKLDPCEETGWEFVWAYRCEHEGPFTLQREEIETGAWVSVADINRRLAENPGAFSGGFRAVWRHYKEAVR